MDRRSLLRQGLTAVGAAAVTPLALHGATRRASTLQEAVDTGDAREVVIFVEDNPRLTGHSPLRVRLAALELLEGDAARKFRERYIYEHERAGEGASASAAAAASSEALVSQLPPPAGFDSVECRARQRAAGIILRESPDDDLLWLATQAGGANAVRAYLTLQLQQDMRLEVLRVQELLEKK